jgi:ABC-type transport system involved in cytochrome bd biosynthesis fused ATPase/permease subunit
MFENTTLLLVFYLITLIFAWQRVVRPTFYVLGAAALVAAMIVSLIFGQISESWSLKLNNIIGMALSIVAFLSLIAACFTGKFSMDVKSEFRAALNDSTQKNDTTPPTEG